ncbi:THAP domain-containing protein 2-like [Stegodyphus dumicola]|uniref:THAP domain-containing protein 2-like n=1 Tax=Stegodyphus dumicola TaxID=202533 RepID=UPI0015B09B1B|nr:THAP domain-containing protein 2-like [Stegodyphus dumicola]
MPARCCVLGCKGNYKGQPKVSIFRFPRDPHLRKKWIMAIHRENFQPTKASRVCELHFAACDIERVSEIYDERTGRKVTAVLQHPRLVCNAVPGKIEIRSFDIDNIDLINTDKNFISAFCTLQVTQNELDSINVMPLITYLAGYCVYRFLKTVKCEYCRET